MSSAYSYPYEIPYQHSNNIPPKTIYQVPSQYPPQRSYQNYQDQPKIVYQDNLHNVRAVPSGKKAKCTNGRILCIALLLLLLAVVLAAIIIPIIVIALNSSTTTSTCATTFSQTFIGGATPTSQCIVWGAYTAGLTCSSYSLMRMSGTNDPTGITVTTSSVATAIAVALRTNTTYTGVSNGLTWKVGSCGSPFEVSATGTTCGCPAGYTIRPCLGGSNWGGINSATCGASTQTMTLYFE